MKSARFYTPFAELEEPLLDEDAVERRKFVIHAWSDFEEDPEARLLGSAVRQIERHHRLDQLIGDFVMALAENRESPVHGALIEAGLRPVGVGYFATGDLPPRPTTTSGKLLAVV